MKSKIKSITVGLLLGAAANLTAFAQDWKIPLNGALPASGGETPIMNEGIEFVEGHEGKALSITDKTVLGYALPSTVDLSKEGTVSMWVKTNWNSKILTDSNSAKQFYYLFEALNEGGASGMKGYIYHYPKNHSVTAYFTMRDKFGIDHSVRAPLPRWEEKHWYRLVFSWKNGEKLAVYLDDGVDEPTLISNSTVDIGVDGQWKDAAGRKWNDVVNENKILPTKWVMDGTSKYSVSLGIWMRRIAWGKVNPNYTESNFLDGAIQDVTFTNTAK